jgi:hypothetical protein
MKPHPAKSSHRSNGWLQSNSLPARCRLFAAVCLGLLATTTRAQDNQLEVNVRTTVVDKEGMWAHTTKSPGEGGHSKIYGILAVDEIKAENQLFAPVDEDQILALLSRELNANGFKLYAPGTKPDIVLTVSYGRGELANPYIRGVGEQGGNASTGAATAGANSANASSALSGNAPGGGVGSNDSGATSLTITGAFATQLMDEKTPGFEAKLQKAAGEKLYIRVTAWTYPSNGKGKSKMLWKTIMVVDDPDHRDLNAVAQKMFEAGVPLFDKEIKDREASIYKPLPDGHVNVGTPEVVPPKSK